MRKKYDKPLELIKCPYCDYYNKPENVQKYGTCTRCSQVLDAKVKFDYEMYCRLKLWRKRK